MKKNKLLIKILIVFIAIVVYIFLLQLLIYFESKSQKSVITDIFNAVWYSIVTLTTVGYGDIYPVTQQGKVIGYIFVISSLGFLGFLIGKLTEWLINLREHRKMGLSGTRFKKHIVIIGWDHFARGIVDQLVNAGNKVAIITDTKNDVDFIKERFSEKQVYVLFTDYTNFDVIKKANIEKAAILFLNFKDDTENLVYMFNIKKVFGELDFIITINNVNLKSTFQGAGVNYVLSRDEVAAKIVASYIFEPDVAQYNADLLTTAKSDNDYDIQEYRVINKNPYLNSNYGDAFLNIKKDFNSILIGISKIENGKRVLYKNAVDSTKIELGDYLILITNGRLAGDIRNAFGIKEGVLTE